jgi:hypothetical protein
MMELKDFVEQVSHFDALRPREKIQLFAWYLHTHRSTETFDYEAIRNCYKELHLIPDDVSVYIPRMAACSPPDLVKQRGSYKLARSVRSTLDAKYGVHRSVVQVSKLLSDLPDKVPDIAERTFLHEAMKCYRVEAYRACIVMTWNLAFDHLLRWILKDAQRLNDFNGAIAKRFPKKPPCTIVTQDHFEELRESEIIEVCNSASLMSGNIIKILKEKLAKRNAAAHPSSVVVVQSQADDVVTDLVNNVVLALS